VTRSYCGGRRPPATVYGRVVAYAFAVRDARRFSPRAELIAAGFARVGGHAGGRACAVELLAREKTRPGGQALAYGLIRIMNVINARPLRMLLARQRPILRWSRAEWCPCVKAGSTIYVNFGRHWSEDFTVTILKRNERNFTAAGLDLKGLAGRRVRVAAGSSNGAQGAARRSRRRIRSRSRAPNRE